MTQTQKWVIEGLKRCGESATLAGLHGELFPGDSDKVHWHSLRQLLKRMVKAELLVTMTVKVGVVRHRLYYVKH